MYLDVISPATPVLDITRPEPPTVDITTERVVVGAGTIARSAKSGDFLYVGKASIGAAEDAAVWAITRIELDELCNIVEELHALNVKWTDYLTEIYS